MSRLDEFALAEVGFMKIDVEGHELAVLTGASETIRRSKPRLIIECEERHRKNAVETVRAFLEPLGYLGFALSRHGIVTIEQTGSPRRSTNYIFLHSTDDVASQWHK